MLQEEWGELLQPHLDHARGCSAAQKRSAFDILHHDARDPVGPPLLLFLLRSHSKSPRTPVVSTSFSKSTAQNRFGYTAPPPPALPQSPQKTHILLRTTPCLPSSPPNRAGSSEEYQNLVQRQQMKACMNILVMVQGLQGGRQMERSNSNSSTMEVPATISLCKNVLVVRRPPFHFWLSKRRCGRRMHVKCRGVRCITASG